MEARGQTKKELKAFPMDVDDILEPSYDILEWFPIGYCEDVFKYLKGKDIKQASGVNKEWRKFCNENKQAAKLKMVFGELKKLRLIRKSVDMTKRSKRKYQNIELCHIQERFSKYIPEVLEHRAGCWKSLRFNFCTIDGAKWSRILQVIEPTVEELFVRYSFPEELLRFDAQWTFPRLKRLHIDGSSNRLCAALVGCTSLVKFQCLSRNIRPIGVKPTLLLNNRNLEDLTITADEITLENLRGFKFQLKKLSLFGNYRRLSSPKLVYAFLETQARTLESLKIYPTLSRDSLELILNMPRLTSLTTSKIAAAITEDGPPLPANTTIAFLKIYLYGLNDQQRNFFDILIKALMNLKHFECDTCDELVFHNLACEVPALESFVTDSLKITRWPEGEIFPIMKKFRCLVFEHNVQKPIGDGNFAKLAKKELRKYFSNPMS